MKKEQERRRKAKGINGNRSIVVTNTNQQAGFMPRYDLYMMEVD